MAALRSALENLGAADVATIVQSGNIAFDTDLDEPGAMAIVETAVKDCSGLTDVPVVLRESHEVEALMKAVTKMHGSGFVGGAGDNVFLPTKDPKKLHVVFTADRRSPKRMTASEVKAFAGLIAPDVFSVVKSHIVLHTPTGIGRSKAELPRWERLTNDHCTVRNWSTVSKLVTL
jgi:uncharacterized protein (DUF1697 family)